MSHSKAMIDVIGMDKIHHYISIQGSIGAGKSTFLSQLKKYVALHRIDATEASHIDYNDVNKDYYLIIDEPVDEWTKKRYTDQSRTFSILEAFYENMELMGFPFQINAFMTRLMALVNALNRIIHTDFPRRIHIISERSLSADYLFFSNVCNKNDTNLQVQWDIYERFFRLICDAIVTREDYIVYLPVPAAVCYDRVQRRNRLDSNETRITEEYLVELDEKHEAWITEFMKHSGRRVDRLNEFKEDMSVHDIERTVTKTMKRIAAFVGS